MWTQIIYGSLAVIALVGSAGLWLLWFPMRPLHPHRGDGDFRDISFRWPWGTFGLAIRGYTITFPTFTLGEPYEAEFYMRELPDISTKPVVYLCIADPKRSLRGDEERKRLTAEIAFDMLDQDGKPVCHVVMPIAKMYWAAPEGGGDCYGLYALPDSHFASRKNGQYKLRVAYRPDRLLSGFRGFVHVRCGGSI